MSVVKSVRQICFITEDIEKTMKFYQDVMGVEKWDYVVEDTSEKRPAPHLTHGKEIPIRFKLAKTLWNNIEIELVEPVSGDSIYAEWVKEHGYGMHHLYLEVTDFDEAVKEFSSRYEIIQEAVSYLGTKVIFFDSTKDLGYQIELGLRNYMEIKK